MPVDNHREAKKITTISGSNRNTFDNLSRATSFDSLSAEYKQGTYSISYYNRYKGVSYKPFDLKGQNFGFNLKSDATPVKCTLAVRMRIDSSYDIDVPSVKFNLKAKTNLNNTKSYHQTGWHNGYYVNGTPLRSGKREKLSKGWWLFEYEFPYEEFLKGGFDPSDFSNDNFSVDLRFRDANVSGSYNYWCQFQIAYMYMRVDYVLPNHNIRFVETSTNGKVLTGETFYLDAIYTQSEKDAVHGGNITFDVSPQWGEEILSYSITGDSSYNPSTKKWTVNSNGIQEHKLHFALKSHVIDDNSILFNNPNKCSFVHDTWVGYGIDGGYDAIRLSFDGAVKQYTKSCMIVSIDGYSSNATSPYTLTSNSGIRILGWEVIEDTGISINTVSSDKSKVTLNVPVNQRFKAYLKVCFISYGSGDTTFTVTSDDTQISSSIVADLLTGTEYHVSSEQKLGDDNEVYFYCPTDNIYLRTNRVASDIESGVTILPFKADDGDATMYQSGISLNFKQLEELDYIGCVPLEQTHFDPKSTYKDTLLNTTYKNKKYMGKKLASDEDITLNVRLHPQQVTTIQGLIDMDKPIPINANHRCFEGDALNHRGWAEIYAIKTEQTGNNPHWYKCDIDVKYLTHNLNTRLNIERGNQVSNYPITDVMYFRVNSGDTLSLPDNYTGNLTFSDFYFRTDTDGTYQHLSDVDPTLSNQFSINNKQSLKVSSREKLANITRVGFEWNSVILDEFKENNISRLVKLVDENNNSVFEYEYTDYEFEYDSSDNVNNITANVVYRVKTPNGWDIVNTTINLRMLFSDNDMVIIDESQASVSANVKRMYGSTIHLELNNNKLKVIDEGFNGREVYTENAIDLQGDSYYFVTEWINNNSDAETVDCQSYFDFIVEETKLTSEFANKYSKCIVSPFPVAKKNLLFTRDAEEGTLYYYEDDGEEFTYLIEPYYQYQNGTDLVTSDGISIFNLNYGYEIVYIQNGLVRLGFDRINGNISLAKYDAQNGNYITTHRFSLEKYSDINTKSISDDKIEIQASDIIFTIWRGHPYIMINHPTEDLLIDTRFGKVWAEGVGSFALSEYPEYWDLENTTNLLPSCVGGVKDIKKSCLDADTENITRIVPSFDWNGITSFNDTVVGVEKTFAVDGGFTSLNMSDEIDYNKYGKCIFGDYTFSESTNHYVATYLLLSSDKSLLKSTETIPFYAKLTDSDRIGLNNKTINYTVSNGVVVKETSSSTSDSDGNSSYTYTGKGLGWLNVQADSNDSYYNIKSEKYPFLDAMFRDVGTNYCTSGLSKIIESNAIFIENINDNYGIMFFSSNSLSTSVFFFRPSVTFEFDLISYTGTFRIRLVNSDSNIQELFSSSNPLITGNNHIKITWNESSIDYWIDGVKRTINNTPNDARRFGFRIDSTAQERGTFRYANLCYYYDTPNSLFFDKGTLEYKNNDWYYSDLVVSTDNTGTLLTNTGSSPLQYRSNSTSSALNTYLFGKWCVEFDVVSFTTNPSVRLIDTNSSAYDVTFNTMSLTGSHHVKIVFENNYITPFVDGVEKTTRFTRDFTGNLALAFRLSENGTLKYKNFNAYLLSDDTVESIDITANQYIQSGETSVIKIVPKGENDYPVFGVPVDLYKDNSKITTLNTGSMGYATYTYTGTGIGEVKFKAKYGNLSSETFSVYDCIFYDEGTTGTPNARWWTSSNSTLTSDNTGLTFETTYTSSRYCSPKKNGNETTLDELTNWESPFVCELTYVSHTGSYTMLEFRFNNDGVVSSSAYSLQNCSEGDVIQAEYDGTTIKYYKNGVYESSDNKTGATMIRLNIKNGSIKFKDFKIYPI